MVLYYNKNSSTLHVEGKGLSKKEQETLSFFKDFLPYNLISLYRHILPKDTQVPNYDADDAELLGFYMSITSKRVLDLIDRVYKLPYPILSFEDLHRKLGLDQGKPGVIELDMINSLRNTDFPLLSPQRFLPIPINWAYWIAFASCYRDYKDCLRKAKNSSDFEAAKRNCDFVYPMCGGGAGDYALMIRGMALPLSLMGELETRFPPSVELESLNRLYERRLPDLKNSFPLFS